MSGGGGVCVVDGSGVVVKRVRDEDRVIELGGGFGLRNRNMSAVHSL